MGSHDLLGGRRKIAALSGLLAVLCAWGIGSCDILCNTKTYSATSPDGAQVVIDDLVKTTLYTQGQYYKNQYPANNPYIWGYAFCDIIVHLSAESCTACLRTIGEKLRSTCRFTLGGQNGDLNCAVRFEFYPIDD